MVSTKPVYPHIMEIVAYKKWKKLAVIRGYPIQHIGVGCVGTARSELICSFKLYISSHSIDCCVVLSSGPFPLYPCYVEVTRLRRLPHMAASVTAFRLGRVSYGNAWQLQKAVFNVMKASANASCHSLLLLEHNPVYTIGVRQKDPANDYSDSAVERLRQLGAEFVR